MPGKGKRTVTLEELEEIEGMIKKRALALSTVRKTMDAKGLTTIEAMGLPMVERGIRSIDSFVRSCQRETGDI